MKKRADHIDIPSSEITPEKLYLSRRDWLKMMGVITTGALLTACGIKLPESAEMITEPDQSRPAAPVPDHAPEQTVDEIGDPANTYEEITNYNNYYEFSTSKEAVASLSTNFRATPWTLEVSGLVHNPRSWSIEDLLRLPQKDRVYRMRCVEGWSMVIPWTGFQLSDLIKQVDPMTSAKYLEFTTLLDENQMPGIKNPFYPWPYQEGLRLDEAMHRLTMIATGIYGRSMPNQNGAPLRLVVPWKYGFKSIKSIIRIKFTAEQPQTFWNTIAPNEYGFYSNVNPTVDHPRWSQKTERRIGEFERRPTLMFNGYGEEVSGLYTGLDLNVHY